jgi:hypothetical protein
MSGSDGDAAGEAHSKRRKTDDEAQHAAARDAAALAGARTRQHAARAPRPRRAGSASAAWQVEGPRALFHIVKSKVPSG